MRPMMSAFVGHEMVVCHVRAGVTTLAVTSDKPDAPPIV